MGFKKDFAWGVATSAYQIEGAYNEDGKGLNVWDVFSHEPGNITTGDTGDVACDHYHRFREDVALMRSLGIKAYRFSLSWSRIFPDGTGKVSEKGAAFYSELIDELISAGIEPYITLFHWDYPYALHRRGGWLNDESVQWFAEYAAKVSELYSDRVKYFITLNEPQCFIGYGYMHGGDAPNVNSSYKDLFRICHNVLKAHGAAVIALRENAKQEIKVGYAPTCTARYPATDSADDIDAARKSYFACPPLGQEVMWNVSWWSDPVILGEYPKDGLRMYREYLPEITEEDMKLISQPLDFYAQNIYNGKEVRQGADGEPEFVAHYPGFPRTGNGWPITPECMRWGPKFLYERYKLPIYITENGMSAPDVIALDGKVHDPNRIDFLNRYLAELEKVADEGVDIGGYFLWSFLDNFEWRFGYSSRFGIVFADYRTQKRIPKDSAYWYQKRIENHKKTLNGE